MIKEESDFFLNAKFCPIFVSGRIHSAADYVLTPCGVVRRRRCRCCGWREGSN